jgi:hypothetical protein
MIRALPTVVFNAAGAMPSDRGPLAKRCLASAAKQGVLLLGVECDDLDRDDVRDVLDPDLWWIRHRQHDDRDGAFMAGLRSRTRVSDVQAVFGAAASPVNAPRWFLKGNVHVDDDAWSFTASPIHVPRWKAGGAQAAAEMVSRSRTIGCDLLAGDFNIRREEMLARYPRRTVRGVEVMHAVANPNRLALGAALPFNLLPGTDADDHPGLRILVRPATKE